jgi:UDP-N-acetylmuramyl pentapeptide phosphotransferase/UDP-N-acetylglucosamine-1-phosphate transferase
LNTLFVCFAFALQLGVTFLVLLPYQGGRLTVGMDDHLKTQGTHVSPTPRIGGILIYICLLILSVLEPLTPLNNNFLTLVLYTAFPIVFAASIEDLYASNQVWLRLLAAFASGSALVFIGDLYLQRTEIPVIDELMAEQTIVAAFVTVVAISALTNSVNIIDGFNGLATSVSLLGLFGLGYFAALEHLYQMAFEILVVVSVMLGFSFFNFPSAKIFLGDSGAYLLGFFMAAYGLKIISETAISPYAVLLTFAYPAVEIVFSVTRKLFGSGLSPLRPDQHHLHLMVFRIVKNNIEKNYATNLCYKIANPAVTFLLLPLVFAPVCIALIFPYNTLQASVSFLIYFVIYSIIYYEVRKSCLLLSP